MICQQNGNPNVCPVRDNYVTFWQQPPDCKSPAAVEPQQSGKNSFEGAKYGHTLLNIARRRTLADVTSDFESLKRTCKEALRRAEVMQNNPTCEQELRGRDGKRSSYSPVLFPLVRQIHAGGCTEAQRWIIHVLCLTFQAQRDTVWLPLRATEESPSLSVELPLQLLC